MLALIIVARLLQPADFGLFALGMLLFTTIQLCSDFGMVSAVIHSDADRQKVSFQAFYLTISLNVLLIALVWFNREQVAYWLGQPTIVQLIPWILFMVFIEALGLIPGALLNKEMRFGQVSKAMIVSNTVDNVAAVALAFSGYGLWSLVYGKLLSIMVKVLLIWYAHSSWRWLPLQQWEWSISSGLIRYSYKGTLAGIMDFFNSRWDDWLVGTMLGATALGFYDKAYALTNGTIVGMNANILSGVLFPSYIQLRNEPGRLSDAFIKSLRLSALVMAPVALGLLAIAPEVVPLVFGEQWIPMIPTLQIFAIMAWARPMAGTTSPLFRALGRPDYDFRAGFVVALIMIPLALVLLSQGIEGVAIAVTMGYIGGLLFNIYQVHLILPNTAAKMMPAILPSLIASLLMVGGIAWARVGWLPQSGISASWLQAALLITVGAALYIVAMICMQRVLLLELFDLLKTLCQSLVLQASSRFRQKKILQQDSRINP